MVDKSELIILCRKQDTKCQYYAPKEDGYEGCKYYYKYDVFELGVVPTCNSKKAFNDWIRASL